ncbi:MAG TPA: sigma-70 family RNA polymerase sigma factor [Acidocella sp.]|nr:sigma-70 family RNA polymerase sigma factor [Acidocella sp.]
MNGLAPLLSYSPPGIVAPRPVLRKLALAREALRWSGLSPSSPAQPERPGAEFAGFIRAIATVQDRAAFVALYGHFAPRVKSYLLRLGAGTVLAEDLAQEALLSVWAKAAYFDPDKASVSTWIFTIARNLHIDARRRARAPARAAAELANLPDAAVPEAADMVLFAAQQQERLRAALVHLPANQAEVVRLSFFQDKPHAEIERELGIPLGTVKSRLRLAIAQLRSLLDAPK